MPYILVGEKKPKGTWKRKGTPFIFTEEEVDNLASNSTEGTALKVQNTTTFRVKVVKGRKPAAPRLSR